MATGYYLLDNPQHRDYPQRGYPRRGGAKASGTIILHDAEGGTDLVGVDMGAENVARYILTRGSYGSYHDLVDRDTHIPMAPIDYETWHSVPDNPWSVGICVAWTKADLPRMTYAQRRSYYVPLARVVLKRVAEFARRGITVPIDRMLTAAETQARKPGISTHSRTDPSRRSDPFGTGSVYEREFLEVLAAEAKNPTQEDDVMTPTQEKKLDRALALLEKFDEKGVREAWLRERIAGTNREREDGSRVDPSVSEDLSELRTFARRAERKGAARDAAIATLATAAGIDPDIVTATIERAVDKALADLTITLTTDTEN